MGKSCYSALNPDIACDSDSSEFHWAVKGKERNPDFPNNYIKHIKKQLDKYKYVFVSSHLKVREALVENGLYYHLVFPASSRKREFLTNYRNRGNDDSFIELLDKNYYTWVNSCFYFDGHSCFLEMEHGFIEDAIKQWDL